jgi:hypothetical protein
MHKEELKIAFLIMFGILAFKSRPPVSRREWLLASSLAG